MAERSLGVTNISYFDCLHLFYLLRLLYRHILDGEVDELTDCRKDDEALVNRGDVKEERRAEIGSETKIDQPMEGVEMSTPVTDTPVLLPSSSETNQQLHVIAKFFKENTAFQIFLLGRFFFFFSFCPSCFY